MEQGELTLTDLPANVLANICSKLDAYDGKLRYLNEDQPLSALAQSTHYRPRLCLFSTCKQFRHAPEVRALYTGLSLMKRGNWYSGMWQEKTTAMKSLENRWTDIHQVPSLRIMVLRVALAATL